MDGIRTALLTAPTPEAFMAAVEDARTVLGWTVAHMAKRAGFSHRAALHNAMARNSDIGRSRAVRLVDAICEGLAEQANARRDFDGKP